MNVEKNTEYMNVGDKSVEVTTIEPSKPIKYNININQKAIIENGLDINLTCAAIFDFIYNFISSGSSTSINIEGLQYYWVSYQYIIDSMPLLGIKNKETISRNIKKLVNCGLLEMRLLKEMNNKTFYRVGVNASVLFFGNVSTQRSIGVDSKIDRVSTQKSNNSYINDSDINNTNKNKNDHNNDRDLDSVKNKLELDFDEIWKIYPSQCPDRLVRLRTDKKTSFERYKSSLKKWSHNQIILYINSYISDCKKTRQYMKQLPSLMSIIKKNNPVDVCPKNSEQNDISNNDPCMESFKEIFKLYPDECERTNIKLKPDEKSIYEIYQKTLINHTHNEIIIFVEEYLKTAIIKKRYLKKLPTVLLDLFNQKKDEIVFKGWTEEEQKVFNRSK